MGQNIWKQAWKSFSDYDLAYLLISDDGKWKFSIITEKILKSISSAVYLSQHLLFSELTQPVLRSQKVNKNLTPSAKIHKGLLKQKPRQPKTLDKKLTNYVFNTSMK